MKQILIKLASLGYPKVTEESNSDVNEDGKKINPSPVTWCDQTLKSQCPTPGIRAEEPSDENGDGKKGYGF